MQKATPALPITQGIAHLILLSVRKRIHCGIGLFCLAFFASFRLMRNVFCDGCMPATMHRSAVTPLKLSHSSPLCGHCGTDTSLQGGLPGKPHLPHDLTAPAHQDTCTQQYHKG